MRTLAIIVAAILTACSQDPEGERTISGQYLGKPDWVAVDPGDSKISLPQGMWPIESVERATYAGRVAERIELEKGYIWLTESAEGGFADFTSDREFIAIFDDLKIGGKPLREDNLDPGRKHPITYAEFTRSDRPCLVFIRPIGLPLPLARGGHAVHKGTVDGYFCGTAGQADFTGTALGYVKLIDLANAQ